MNDSSSIKIARLITLEKKIREANSEVELEFLVVNELRDLVDFNFAFLLRSNQLSNLKVKAISDISVVDHTAPLILYVENILKIKNLSHTENFQEIDLNDYEIIKKNLDRPENIPNHIFELNLSSGISGPQGKLLLFSAEKFTESEKEILKHISGTIAHAFYAFRKNPSFLSNLQKTFGGMYKWLILLIISGVMMIPVKMSVLAPVQVSANNPTIVTSPINGVVQSLLIETNDRIEIGDELIRFDDTDLKNQYEVALQTLAVAEAELLRNRQSSFINSEDKSKIAGLATTVGLKKKELKYAREKLNYVSIKANASGVAIIVDKSGWQGKPVTIGEKIMTIAQPNEINFTIYLPVKDSLVIAAKSRVKIFLDISPLNTIEGTIDRTSYQPELTAENVLAYKVIASPEENLNDIPRIGLRGTAKIYGDDVTLFYYLFRIPINITRQWLGY